MAASERGANHRLSPANLLEILLLSVPDKARSDQQAATNKERPI